MTLHSVPEPPTEPDPVEPDYFPIEPRCFCGRLLQHGVCPVHGGSINVHDDPEEEQ